MVQINIEESQLFILALIMFWNTLLLYIQVVRHILEQYKKNIRICF